jgi:hypothetical protein
MSPRGRRRSRRFNVHRSFAFRSRAPPDQRLPWHRRSGSERRQPVADVGPGSRTGTPSLRNVSHTRRRVWTWVHVDAECGHFGEVGCCRQCRGQTGDCVGGAVAFVATSRYDSDSNHPAAVVAGSSAGKTPREPVGKGVLVAVMGRWAGLAARDCFSPWRCTQRTGARLHRQRCVPDVQGAPHSWPSSVERGATATPLWVDSPCAIAGGRGAQHSRGGQGDGRQAVRRCGATVCAVAWWHRSVCEGCGRGVAALAFRFAREAGPEQRVLSVDQDCEHVVWAPARHTPGSGQDAGGT